MLEAIYSRSGMRPVINLAQTGNIYAGIALGGLDAGVTEHFLNGAQVSPAGKQVRGEGVTQDVGGHRFSNASFLRVGFDQRDEMLPGHRAALMGDEQVRRRGLVGKQKRAGGCPIRSYRLPRALAHGDLTLFAAFTEGTGKTGAGVHVFHF